MDQSKVIVIGAAGEMARAGIERLSAHIGERSLELYDLTLSRLEQLATTLGPRRVRVGVLDLFDDEALKRTIRGASLVILGAGPYIRTAAPVMRACIETGVDYLDFDDDVESTQEALQLDSEARAAGVALLIGCGASPGMSNVMAIDAASQLDEVESIDVCFVTGDEGPRPYGAAVIEHMLHISAGECLTWRNGKQVSVQAAAASEVYSFGGSIGDFRVYEVAHPEAVTLPRRFPGAWSVRVLGGLHPQPGNGVWQGIARAVGRGKMTTPEAVAWLQEVGQDRLGSAKGWLRAFRDAGPGKAERELFGCHRQLFMGGLASAASVLPGMPPGPGDRNPRGAAHDGHAQNRYRWSGHLFGDVDVRDHGILPRRLCNACPRPEG